MTDVPVGFFKILNTDFVIQFFNSLSSPICYQLLYSLYSFCIFEHVSCLICLHFHTLPHCLVFLF